MFSVLSLSQVWYQYLRIGLQCRRPWFNSWVRKIHCRRDRPHTPVFLGFLRGLAGKESACNMGHWGSIPGLGRSPREGNDYPLQYSGLENSMDCIVHWVAKSQTWLSDFHFLSGEKFVISGDFLLMKYVQTCRYVACQQLLKFTRPSSTFSHILWHQIRSDQSLNCVQLFATPET